MNTSTKLLLVGIFLITLASRLLIAFHSDQLNYGAYGDVRQIEHIIHTGKPLIDDPLSYEGRAHTFSPLYDYFLAFFALFMPIALVLKIIPNILASLAVIIIFFISYRLTENQRVSLVTAVFGATIPVFFTNTINNASMYAAVIPLMLVSIHFFILTNKDAKHLYKLIICLVLLTLLHPSSLILTLGMLVYVLLIKVQGFRESLREPEIVLFFVFFALWINMIIYKKALMMHGPSVIWQNLPQALISLSFSQLTFLESIYNIGIIPLIAGLASIYLSLFRSKSKTITLLMSTGIVVFLLLLARFIELETGLMFLGILLAVLSSYSLKHLFDMTKQMKLQSGTLIAFLFILGITLITFLPNVEMASGEASITPSQKDIEAFRWLGANTPENSSVLVLAEEGSAMSYFSGRKNIMDEDYLLIKNIDTRYTDTNNIYSERFLTSALDTLNYYSVNYVMVSEYNSRKTNVTKLMFADDRCITKVYPESGEDTVPSIYAIRCVLSTQ